MAALLTTDTAAVLCHILVNILVAHGSLSITNALLIKRFVQTKVRHNGRNHSIGQQLATLFHVAAIDIQDMVASDDITLLVYAQAAIGIAIEGKTNIQPLLHNKLLQALNMRRASIGVDVRAVRLVVYDIGVCTQRIENAFSDVPRTAVGAV